MGPVAGFVYCVVGGWLVAKVSSTRHVLHGTILGAAVAAIDSLLLIASGSSFEILFVISNAGRLMAGAVGGMLAGRLHAARANLA